MEARGTKPKPQWQTKGKQEPKHHRTEVVGGNARKQKPHHGGIGKTIPRRFDNPCNDTQGKER